MSPAVATYASPKIAKHLAKVFGDNVQPVEVRMRASTDVSKFIRLVEEAHKKAAKSRLRFA